MYIGIIERDRRGNKEDKREGGDREKHIVFLSFFLTYLLILPFLPFFSLSITLYENEGLAWIAASGREEAEWLVCLERDVVGSGLVRVLGCCVLLSMGAHLVVGACVVDDTGRSGLRGGSREMEECRTWRCYIKRIRLQRRLVTSVLQ